MSKILTVIFVAIAWLMLSLVVLAIHYPTSLMPDGWVAFRKPRISGNHPPYRESTRTVSITVASASVYGDEDADRDKTNEKSDGDEKKEKDEENEDQGQIRLWDSVLLG